MIIKAELERWPTAVPFHITGHVWTEVPVLVVEIGDGDHVGRGEACGIYYKGETAETMLSAARRLAGTIGDRLDRRRLHELVGPSGVRNAFDCALWDLEAQQAGIPVWTLAGIPAPKPLRTTYTLGAEAPAIMASRAASFVTARALKLKLTGEAVDADRVRAVRETCPDHWIGVDANQGLTPATYDALLPALVEARVALLEQPFPIGADRWLDALDCPIPIAADESVQDVGDIAGLVGRADVINIKLDKCGGLTRGLEMARTARGLGLDVMVGNMLGTSLSMAPAFLLGQLCQVVDLDGPIQLRADRRPGVRYTDDGCIDCPADVWGAPQPLEGAERS